ncbi:lysylphosphatidylglycerol synthase transmembrane domain-containing protein [Granulicella arctica]|uniref:lysylphosphatidylglycerol synthase transmembrane domain-containing protein n=1 Tax=Granulicella arctica TaxID=940613 RepID=UPI0021DFBB14|nr:lysylphosphatidylglycerol synthase transmembrane domain-containing protein [Granulicella arctica]
MKKRNAIFLVILIALAVTVFLNRGRIHFDWSAFMLQLRTVSLGHLAAGIALIWGTFWLRAWRWSIFISPTKKVPFTRLVGSQFIGFTAVALFGRLADLTRPYLLAKRVDLSLSSQVAVYTIERMFDLAAAAIIFSTAMAVTPKGLPHHDLFVRVGLGSLVVTVAIAVFAVSVRIAGGAVAAFARTTIGRLSKPAGESFATKVLGFRDGLNTLASFQDFLLVLAISLTMWGMIGGAYYETAHAFVRTPELAGLTFSRTMLLMAASIGGGLLTLPIIGWFTQIAAMAAAMQAFYGAPIEAATACGALLLVVTMLSIVPVGLIFAQIEQVSLKPAAIEHEAIAGVDAAE